MDAADANRSTKEAADAPGRDTPVALADPYLRAVSRLEALPGNRPRADKSWVESTLREFRELVNRATRVR